MNPVIVLVFVIMILAGLFFSLYSLFKMVFVSVGQGIEQNLGGNILTSPPSGGGEALGIFLSSILAAVISVVLIISLAIVVIKRGSFTRVIGRQFRAN